MSVYISNTTQCQGMIYICQDENGTNRPVCSYVKPLRAGRLLDTPRQAARLVSLIHNEKVPTLGGGDKREQWTNMHAFLCRNKGVRGQAYSHGRKSCLCAKSVANYPQLSCVLCLHSIMMNTLEHSATLASLQKRHDCLHH